MKCLVGHSQEQSSFKGKVVWKVTLNKKKCTGERSCSTSLLLTHSIALAGVDKIYFAFKLYRSFTHALVTGIAQYVNVIFLSNFRKSKSVIQKVASLRRGKSSTPVSTVAVAEIIISMESSRPRSNSNNKGRKATTGRNITKVATMQRGLLLLQTPRCPALGKLSLCHPFMDKEKVTN